MTFDELVIKVEELISLTIQSGGSRYIKFTKDNTEDTTWTIRVSDHNANPDRVDSNTISLIVPCNNTYSEVVSKFKSIPCQYLLDEDGYFVENFYDVKECLEYNIY